MNDRLIEPVEWCSMLSLKCHFRAGREVKPAGPESVLKLSSRCPALVAARGSLSSQCNALPCVLSLTEGTCAQQYPFLEPVGCGLKT